MSYGKRIMSSTGAYHSTSRGVGRQNIFEDKEDRGKFLEKLAMVSEKYGIIFFTYALVPNHFHILLWEKTPMAISKAMQVLKSTYAKYFNRKYGRKGTLYESRFFSRPVEDNDYMVTVIRYILQNPPKTGEGLVWTNFDQLSKPIVEVHEFSKAQRSAMAKKAWKAVTSGNVQSFVDKAEAANERHDLNLSTKENCIKTLPKRGTKIKRPGNRAMHGLMPTELVRMLIADEVSPCEGKRGLKAFIKKGLKDKEYWNIVKKLGLKHQIESS